MNKQNKTNAKKNRTKKESTKQCKKQSKMLSEKARTQLKAELAKYSVTMVSYLKILGHAIRECKFTLSASDEIGLGKKEIGTIQSFKVFFESESEDIGYELAMWGGYEQTILTYMILDTEALSLLPQSERDLAMEVRDDKSDYREYLCLKTNNMMLRQKCIKLFSTILSGVRWNEEWAVNDIHSFADSFLLGKASPSNVIHMQDFKMQKALKCC